MEWPGPGSDDGLEIFMRLWVEDVVRFLLVMVAAALVAFVVISLVGAWGTDVVRRRFFCRLAWREVEVEFWAEGLLLQPAAVRSCSVFEGGCPSCTRPCVEAAFRKQWEPALPVFSHQQAGA